MPRRDSSKVSQNSLPESDEELIDVEDDGGGGRKEDTKDSYVGPFKGLTGMHVPHHEWSQHGCMAS